MNQDDLDQNTHHQTLFSDRISFKSLHYFSCFNDPSALLFCLQSVFCSASRDYMSKHNCHSVIACTPVFKYFFLIIYYHVSFKWIHCYSPHISLLSRFAGRGVTPLRAAIFLPSSWHTRVVLINWCGSADTGRPPAPRGDGGHFTAVVQLILFELLL